MTGRLPAPRRRAARRHGRKTTGLLAAGAVFLAATAALAGENRLVRVYNWSNYIDREILADFEADTGIEVVYETYDSTDVLERNLLAGGARHDVVVLNGTMLASHAGLFRALDRKRLTNVRNMDPAIVRRVRAWDPQNDRGMPYMWGTTGIAFNPAMIAERDPNAPVRSWRMLFDPEVVARFANCGVYLLDEPNEVIPAVLNFIGEDPASRDIAVIARAEPVLMAIRPHVRRFHNLVQDLANGRICLAMGWSGDMLQARNRARASGNTVEYVIPDEGALMWFDLMTIPADAPHPDHAHRFIDYMMEPKVIAKASNHVFYANANIAANPHLDRRLTADPAIYPPPSVRENLYALRPYPPEVQRFLLQLWERVKSAR